MKLVANNAEKHKLSHEMVLNSIGGRIVVAVGIVCVVAGVLVTAYAAVSSQDDQGWGDPFSLVCLLAGFWGCALMFIAIANRQFGFRAAMFADECVVIEESILHHTYVLRSNESGSADLMSEMQVHATIDLRTSTIQVSNSREIVFEGPIQVRTQKHLIGTSVLNDTREIQQSQWVITDYFSPRLDKTLETNGYAIDRTGQQ